MEHYDAIVIGSGQAGTKQALPPDTVIGRECTKTWTGRSKMQGDRGTVFVS